MKTPQERSYELYETTSDLEIITRVMDGENLTAFSNITVVMGHATAMSNKIEQLQRQVDSLIAELDDARGSSTWKQ